MTTSRIERHRPYAEVVVCETRTCILCGHRVEPCGSHADAWRNAGHRPMTYLDKQMDKGGDSIHEGLTLERIIITHISQRRR